MQRPEWRLPGPNRFARTIAGDLDDGRCVLILLPARGFPDGLQVAVREVLPHVEANRFRLAQLTEGRGRIVDALYQRLDLKRPEDHASIDVSSLASHPGLGRRLIWVDGREATQDQLEYWAAFVEQYAAAAADVSVHRRTVFAFLYGGAHAHVLPESPALLAQRWWWGAISPLDTEVFVSELVGSGDRQPAFVETVAEVAAFDLSLAAMLVEEWDGAPENLSRHLGDYQSASGQDGLRWSREPSPRQQPPIDSIAAWGAGIVNAWGERDPHAHACHVYAGNPNALNRLIWLGQVRSLMPRIEIERQALAEWVHARRNRLPPTWQARDIRSLEVGELSAVFALPAFRNERRRVPLARWLHRARNAIAHLEILDGEELANARRLLRGMPPVF